MLCVNFPQRYDIIFILPNILCIFYTLIYFLERNNTKNLLCNQDDKQYTDIKITNKRLALSGNQEVRRNRSLQCFVLLFAVHPMHAWQEQIDCDEQ